MSSGWANLEQIDELDRLVKNIKIYGGEIKYSAEGISIVIPEIAPQAAGFEYDGPFKVVKKVLDPPPPGAPPHSQEVLDAAARTVTIQGHNKKRFWHNEIYLGITRITIPEGEQANITTSQFIILNISFVSPSYSVVYDNVPSITPVQGRIFVPLAWIDCVGGKITKITQLQFGIVNFPARIL